MRRGKSHPSLLRFRLCKEMGWTPRELDQQPAADIEAFVVILNEMDRQTQEEIEKAKRHGS